MPAGRPTDYNQEVVDKAYQYLCDDDNVNYACHGHAIPSIVGLCRVLNRSRTTLYRWATEEDKEFNYILEQCNELQEFTTVNETLKNNLNANIGKLILGKHGFHERKELSGPEGKPIQVIASEMSAEEASRAYDDIIK